jgi:alkanesulfonate monooxygenase SsuD/methylene tetrahydromethanopterin reductase-like flavin-dependent oxidoreductase (luciferase family)
MRVGMMLGYAGGFSEAVDELADFERGGLDIVFVPEAYSFDAVSQLGFIAARTTRLEIASGILPIYSRTPALTAMTAAGLDFVSGGRFTLGLGTSGPQVIEGWHGVPYDAPVGRTRELVEICRMVWRRDRLDYQGKHYTLPYEGGTGLGKPLKLINHPVRERIPIVIAALGPKNVALAAELAEGWQPIFYFPEKAAIAWDAPLAEGKARRDPALGTLDVIASAPLGRTREIIEICRKVWARERLDYQGKYYQVPLPPGQGTGLGKPLKLINHPVRDHIPVILAAIGPKNVELAAELAEGWEPIFYLPEKAADVWGDALAAGRAKRDPALGPLDVFAQAALAIGDDVSGYLDLGRPMLALYVGGMGAPRDKGPNFYFNLATRYGYGSEAEKIQDAYLSGRKDEAASFVPAELIERTSLIGSEGFVADRVAALKESGVTTLNVTPLAATHAERVALIEKVRDLAG